MEHEYPDFFHFDSRGVLSLDAVRRFPQEIQLAFVRLEAIEWSPKDDPVQQRGKGRFKIVEIIASEQDRLVSGATLWIKGQRLRRHDAYVISREGTRVIVMAPDGKILVPGSDEVALALLQKDEYRDLWDVARIADDCRQFAGARSQSECKQYLAALRRYTAERLRRRPVAPPLPTGQQVFAATMTSSPGTPQITLEQLKNVLDAAKPLAVDPLYDDWHYAPWCSGTLRTGKETWSFGLFLGGRGRLTKKDGRKAEFAFDPKETGRAQIETLELKAEIILKSTHLRQAEDLEVVVSVTNRSDKPLRLNALFLDLPTIMLKVRTSDGTPVHSLPPPVPPVDDGKAGRVTLAHGQSTKFVYRGTGYFGHPLDPGEYEVQFLYINRVDTHGDWVGSLDSGWLAFEVM